MALLAFPALLASEDAGLHGEHWWAYALSGVAVLTAVWLAATADPQRDTTRHGANTSPEATLPALGLPRAPAHEILAAIAILTLAAAAIHAAVIGEHFAESRLFGIFFAVAASLQSLWALLVGLAPSRPLLLLGAAGNASIILVWILSRAIGVPFGPQPWTREPVGELDLFASIFEALAVYLTLALLSRPASLPPRLSRVSLAAAGLALTVAFVIGWLLLSGGGGH